MPNSAALPSSTTTVLRVLTIATFVVGGQPKQILVTLDPAQLAASGVTPGEVAMSLRSANARLQAGELATANAVHRIEVGAGLESATDVGSVVVGALTIIFALLNAGRSGSAGWEPVTPSARVLMGLRRVLPDRAWDRVAGHVLVTGEDAPTAERLAHRVLAGVRVVTT